MNASDDLSADAALEEIGRVGAAFFTSLVPESPSARWSATGLAVAVAAATPVLYAGWRLHTWERER
ncbi:hypothetical protein AB0O34_14430 [Sphaerisporangium sp. NPDC088356]|uniref:hypothetical protein n=1 Tax=Sphaerisporangium sp. NPDC088356 TaxID=3154871 RepID=UPI00342082E8